MIREEIMDSSAREMATKTESEVVIALNNHLGPDVILPDVAKDCRFERVSGMPYETLFYKQIPLLRLYDVEMQQEICSDSVKICLVRKFQHLHDFQKRTA